MTPETLFPMGAEKERAPPFLIGLRRARMSAQPASKSIDYGEAARLCRVQCKGEARCRICISDPGRSPSSPGTGSLAAWPPSCCVFWSVLEPAVSQWVGSALKHLHGAARFDAAGFVYDDATIFQTAANYS